jgi:hypothetical protein
MSPILLFLSFCLFVFHSYIICLQLISQIISQQMSEIPDCDSYNFRKVDINNAEEKEWFEDLWGWDGKLKGKNFSGNGKILK